MFINLNSINKYNIIATHVTGFLMFEKLVFAVTIIDDLHNEVLNDKQSVLNVLSLQCCDFIVFHLYIHIIPIKYLYFCIFFI